MERLAVDRERRGIRIRGLVQGVGFRPAMYRLADELGLAGFVRNDREGVWIELEGPRAAIDRFLVELIATAPPASRIDSIEPVELAPRGDASFAIAPSTELAGDPATAAIPADLAPCAACVRELEDPADRRFGYPFINCTACGPRFTIVREVPYDRAATTMAPFVMCAACQREYDDPRDRRFHAEPNACPACGPTLQLVADGQPLREGAAALGEAVAALAGGAIIALKGAGGYVLAVDATSERAVARLRERKRRPDKPFAVMARDLAAAEQIAELDDATRALLVSPARPIVLVPARAGSPLAPSVAPRLADVGVFLPPTPLQHLLLARGPALQVMTSGNLSDEPIARTDTEARARLHAIADLFLLHDREIHARADDSVVRTTRRGAIPIRRGRGVVPDELAVPVAGRTVLAVGGHERVTVCLCHDGRALLSQHVGDLDTVEAVRFFEETIAHLCKLAGVTPELVAYDLHPDYRSTRWALASGLPGVAVQHHHAHVAACLAEHGRRDRVIGVAFDGTGYGADGTLWGGELLEADLLGARRLGHLQPITLIGGELAIREPWRLAVAVAHDTGHGMELVPGDDLWRRRIARLLRGHRSGVHELPAMPVATGAGRWFDTIAALLGLAQAPSYDGQPAIELEAAAAVATDTRFAPFDIAILEREPFVLDLRPAAIQVARGRRDGHAVPLLARRFHDTVALAIQAGCHRARAAGAPSTVVLTGGCFQNRILLDRARALLEADGFEVLTHRRVPPNDGGLALGQAAVASALSQRGAHVSRGPR